MDSIFNSFLISVLSQNNLELRKESESESEEGSESEVSEESESDGGGKREACWLLLLL